MNNSIRNHPRTQHPARVALARAFALLLDEGEAEKAVELEKVGKYTTRPVRFRDETADRVRVSLKPRATG